MIWAGERRAEDGSKVFGCGTGCDGGTMAFEPDAKGVSERVSRFRMSWGCRGGGAEGGRVEVLSHSPASRKSAWFVRSPKSVRPWRGYFKRRD